MTAIAEVPAAGSLTLTGLPMPLALRLPVCLSDQELMDFSKSIRPYQVERNSLGELEIMSPNGLRGASLESYVGRMLGNWAADHGGAVISSQGGYMLADNSVRMADASWISASRWSALSHEEREGFARLSPDFLIEIRSRTDSRSRLEHKMEMWIENGAQLAWLIDPYLQEVLTYQPGAAVQRLSHPDWVVAESVVPGFRLETARMWEQE